MTGHSLWYPAQGQLFGEFLGRLWATAMNALRLSVDHSLQMLHAALPAWAEEPIGAAPDRPSYVADDGFLAEMSVNWAGDPEVRLLFDTLSEGHDPAGTWPDARTAAHPFARIHDIFMPSAPLWRSIAWRSPAHVVHKTYFGLYAWPLAQRYAAVAEAMHRLGMSDAWNDARRHVDAVSGQREIEFFAIDQTDDPRARVKIYYRNHGADIDEMNRMASIARHDPQRALAAYRTLTGGGTAAGEGALTCLAFRAGLARVAESTTYLRLADLARSDQEAVDRAAALLHSEGVDSGPLRALAAALVPGPLEYSRGMLSLVSYRAARPRDVTTYFRFPVYEGTR